MTVKPYPGYKASGVEWLGSIPETWSVERIRRRARLRTDKAVDASLKVALENVQSWTGRFIDTEQADYSGEGIAFSRGDVLFGKLRPYLAKAWRADTEGSAIGDFHVYSLSSDTDPRFFQFMILSGDFISLVDGSTYGAKMPRASWDFIGNLMEAFPPFAEQRQIADYLDAHTTKIDTLIGKQERLISALREKRQSIIDGQFKPSKANQPLRLRNLLVARPTYGVLVPIYVETDDSVPFIRVGDLGTLDVVSPLAQISEAQSAEYSRTRIAGGEVLLGVVGRMGQVAITPERLAGANVARAVAVLRCTDRASSELLAIWLTSTKFLDQAGVLTSGDSVQPTLGMGDLAVVGIQWPKDGATVARVLRELKHQIAAIDDLKSKAERFIELSKERRAALITAAVTGKIDVRGLA